MEDLRELPPPPPPDLYDEAIMRTLLNMLAACVRNRATTVRWIGLSPTLRLYADAGRHVGGQGAEAGAAPTSPAELDADRNKETAE
jgi:hypothetical protein